MTTTAELQDYARQAARNYGVPENMFLWQIGAESGWNPNAQNPKSSATGIAQFIDSTEKDFGINALNPYQSLDAAAKYDAQLYQKTGSWQAALTSYGTLHDASVSKLSEFNQALGSDTGMAEMSTTDKILATMKKFYDDSMSGLNGPAYSPEEKAGAADISGAFDKYFKNGAFVVLGIVVIALAILSNNSVRSAAIKAVKV